MSNPLAEFVVKTDGNKDLSTAQIVVSEVHEHCVRRKSDRVVVGPDEVVLKPQDSTDVVVGSHWDDRRNSELSDNGNLLSQERSVVCAESGERVVPNEVFSGPQVAGIVMLPWNESNLKLSDYPDQSRGRSVSRTVVPNEVLLQPIVSAGIVVGHWDGRNPNLRDSANSSWAQENHVVSNEALPQLQVVPADVMVQTCNGVNSSSSGISSRVLSDNITQFQTQSNYIGSNEVSPSSQVEVAAAGVVLSHSSEISLWPVQFKRTVCKQFSRGSCQYGEKCRFTHGVENLHVPYLKSQDVITGGCEVERMNFGKSNLEILPQTRVMIDAGRQLSCGIVTDVGQQSVDARKPVPIYFKRRLCTHFSLGNCQYGDSCNFAHGIEELCVPCPNSQDINGSSSVSGMEERRKLGTNNLEDNQRIGTFCNWFVGGQKCPYGNACKFLHEYPAKYKNAIVKSIASGSIVASEHSQLNCISKGPQPVNTSCCLSPSQTNIIRRLYWKTRICNNWATTGHCRHGNDCSYAHGQEELQKLTNISVAQVTEQPLLNCVPRSDINLIPNPCESLVVSSNDQAEKRRRKLIQMGPKRIGRIYGDWPQ